MTESEYNRLRDLAWRRPLHPAETARVQAFLALHPEAQADWEAESGLSQLLEQLPEAPVSSNFTHQVLQAIDRPARPPATAWLGTRWWQQLVRHPVARLAGTAALLGLLVLGYHRYQVYEQDQLVQGMVQFTSAHGLDEPAIFQDFEVIRRLGQVPSPADEELWLVLSQAQTE